MPRNIIEDSIAKPYGMYSMHLGVEPTGWNRVASWVRGTAIPSIQTSADSHDCDANWSSLMT